MVTAVRPETSPVIESESESFELTKLSRITPDIMEWIYKTQPILTPISDDTLLITEYSEGVSSCPVGGIAWALDYNSLVVTEQGFNPSGQYYFGIDVNPESVVEFIVARTLFDEDYLTGFFDGFDNLEDGPSGEGVPTAEALLGYSDGRACRKAAVEKGWL